MYNFIKLFLVTQLFFLPSILAAQNSNFEIPDLSKVEMPSLEILLESAKKNPSVEMLQSRIEYNESLLTTEQRSWLKYFKIGGSYQYGNVSLNSAFTNEYTPLYYQSTGQIQNTWYGTFGVNIPLDDLFDRKNKIKRIKLDRDFSESEMQKWLDEIHLRITESYMKVKVNMSILHKLVEEYSIANGNFQIVESQFKIGANTLSDLNTAKKMDTEAFERLRKNEYDLLNELFKLEILSKTKIISK